MRRDVSKIKAWHRAIGMVYQAILSSGCVKHRRSSHRRWRSGMRSSIESGISGA